MPTILSHKIASKKNKALRLKDLGKSLAVCLTQTLEHGNTRPPRRLARAQAEGNTSNQMPAFECYTMYAGPQRSHVAEASNIVDRRSERIPATSA